MKFSGAIAVALDDSASREIKCPPEREVGKLLCLTIALRGGARLLLDVICLEEKAGADRQAHILPQLRRRDL